MDKTKKFEEIEMELYVLHGWNKTKLNQYVERKRLENPKKEWTPEDWLAEFEELLNRLNNESEESKKRIKRLKEKRNEQRIADVKHSR